MAERALPEGAGIGLEQAGALDFGIRNYPGAGMNYCCNCCQCSVNSFQILQIYSFDSAAELFFVYLLNSQSCDQN